MIFSDLTFDCKSSIKTEKTISGGGGIFSSPLYTFVFFLILSFFLITAPALAGQPDYRELHETPLDTALRRITSPGVIEWDSEEILSENAPEIAKEMIWPVKTGRISSRFNRYRKNGRRKHLGIDISAPRDTPIYAVLPGTVEAVSGGGYPFRGYGRVTVVKHDNNLWTLYSHCQTIKVKVGQRVKQGEVIATVGRTGRATGNHIHFEVRKEHGYPLDPLKFLPKDSVFYILTSK